MSDAICTILMTVFCCAIGMGIAWWLIFELRIDNEMREHIELVDFYSKRERENALEIWALRRQIADLKGIEFKEPKPKLTYETRPWRR